MKILNLGCGIDYKYNCINLDYNKRFKADVYQNLDKFPYPFKNNEFDLIYCFHILPCVSDLNKTLKELYRILKPEGIIHIRLAHFSNGNGYADFQIKRTFGWYSFDRLFNGNFNTDLKFEIISKRFNFLSVDYPVANTFFSWIWNILPKRFYERFLCWILPVGEIELKIKKRLK